MAAAFIALGVVANAFEIPKEVTPAIRAACEKDVRRLCIRSTSTIDTVKDCVRRNFEKLNRSCQIRLVSAGL
jgi:hypothetical protein